MTLKKTISVLILFASACEAEKSENNKEYIAPNGDYKIIIINKDLGACCSTLIRVQIVGLSYPFADLDKELLLTRGATNINFEWQDPYHLQASFCNARSTKFASDIAAIDFSKYIHFQVKNKKPTRTEDTLSC